VTDMDDGTAVVVLLVEDETLVRLLANDILSEAGYRVLEARDGQDALTILEVHDSIRAILTDVTMPNVDGLALAKIVHGRWPHIGIDITSAVALPTDLPKGARFVRKPYTAKAILEELEAVLAETAAVPKGTAPVALANIVNLRAGQIHGAGGLAQPLREPDE
jgi:CheY-like chemotaxis protein